MYNCRTFLITGLMVLLLVITCGAVSYAAEESVVIGRLFGSTQPLPGFFRANMILLANNVYPEFLGYRFVNTQTGKKIKMRPDGIGFFLKSMEPGTWTFERFRKDRPVDSGPDVIEIMTFDVPEGSLVNLGTIIIVLEGEPTEQLRVKKNWQEGAYVYTYRYFLSDSAEDNKWPIDNLERKKPKVLAEYNDNVVEVKDPITSDLDSSRIILKAPPRRMTP